MNSTADSSEKRLRVVFVEPGKRPEERMIDGSLENLQRLVGGNIEVYAPFDEDVAIICNEEGKIDGLPLNRAVCGEDSRTMDIIAGSFFICATPADSDSFGSLNDRQVKAYAEKFRYPELFIRTGNGISVLRADETAAGTHTKKAREAER